MKSISVKLSLMCVLASFAGTPAFAGKTGEAPSLKELAAGSLARKMSPKLKTHEEEQTLENYANILSVELPRGVVEILTNDMSAQQCFRIHLMTQGKSPILSEVIKEALKGVSISDGKCWTYTKTSGQTELWGREDISFSDVLANLDMFPNFTLTGPYLAQFLKKENNREMLKESSVHALTLQCKSSISKEIVPLLESLFKAPEETSSAPFFQNLQKLTLVAMGELFHDRNWLQALAKNGKSFEKLTQLTFSDCNFKASDVAALTGNSLLEQLTHLTIQGNCTSIETSSLETLLKSSNFPKLTHLEVKFPIPDIRDQRRFISFIKHIPTLERLDLPSDLFRDPISLSLDSAQKIKEFFTSFN